MYDGCNNTKACAAVATLCAIIEAHYLLAWPCLTSSASSDSVRTSAQVYIGKTYVNNPKSHDVVFVVEGKPFYTHKIALTASSAAFHAMFESGCREGSGGVPTIDIPNISHAVFEAMVVFLYTGELTGCPAAAERMPELLEVADQYLLDSLTAACATKIASSLDVSTVVEQYELAMQYNATKLAHAAVAFIAVKHAQVTEQLGEGPVGLARLLVHVRPQLNDFLQRYLWTDDAASPRDGDGVHAGEGQSRAGSPRQAL
jgi:BTB/POZ domain